MLGKFFAWLKSLFVKAPVVVPQPEPVAPVIPIKPVPVEPSIPDYFDRALAYTFVNEGGFSNDANDHGGATKYGITIGDLARWRAHSVSNQDVKDMTQAEAKAIYRAWYWDSMSLSRIKSPGVAIAMFDIGVVMGISIPPKFAQAICNEHGAKLDPDGRIGILTLAAINSMDQSAFVQAFAAKAEARFRGIVANNSSQSVFLKGWLNRAHRLLTLA